jgi:WD40 repeat protein
MAPSVEETLAQVKTNEPVGPRLLNPGIPLDLETICLKCMEKGPSRRYQSAEALAQELGRFLRGEPIQARRTRRVEKVIRWCRREPALATLCFGSLVLLSSVAIGSTWAAVQLEHKHQEELLNAYTTDMFQAQTEWEARNAAETVEYLRKHLPRKGEPDLRGFEWRHLWWECRGDYAFALPAHNQVAGHISFSANGEYFAVYYWDNIIRLWNVGTRTTPLVFRNVAGPGGFSADGERFVVGYLDGTIKAHRTRGGETLTSLPGAGELLAVAANGLTVATMDARNNVSVWNLAAPAKKLRVPGPPLQRSDYSWNVLAALSPDGSILAAVQSDQGGHGLDRGVRRWDTRTEKELPFLNDARQIHCLQFAPDGRSLAVGDGAGKVLVWDLGTSSHEELALAGHDLPILCLAFSPDGKILAAGSSDQTIALWELPAGRPLARTFRGQVGPVWSLAFSPDGTKIVSGSRDNTIKFWLLAAGDPAGMFPRLRSDRIGNFAFSPDSKLMAGGCCDDTVRIWEVETMTQRYALRGVSYVVAFTGDGKRVLVSTEAGAAKWWNFAANQLTPIPAYEQVGQITSVDLSPNRRLAAVGREDGMIEMFEIDSGRTLGIYRGHSGAVLSVAFEPTGRRFASGGRDKAIRFWDPEVPERSLEVCAEHKGAVASLAISPNGQLIASGCSANLVKFWDMRHLNKSLGGIPWHRAAIRSLAFSRNGATLASGSEDKIVRLWNCASRAQLASFKFDNAIRLVVFSPDDNCLAVVTDQGSLTLLRAVSLREADAQADLLGVLR